MTTGSIFDEMMAGFHSEPSGDFFLEDCMSFDPKVMRKVPLRYRIIALGFMRGYSLEELNSRLKEADCAALYSRSYWEAGLIYAFAHHLSYGEWKELEKQCREIRAEQPDGGGFFTKGSVTLKELREYIAANSEMAGQALYTRHVTKAMEKKIGELSGGQAAFGDFMRRNIASFSSVREKTRYYFCKYLCFWLETRISAYLKISGKDWNSDEVLSEIAVFKGITKLRRKKMSEEESRALLEEAGISCGGIFDAFNYFFFEYVSLDWMEIQLEYYGDIGDVPASGQKKLAASYRRYAPSETKGLSDRDVLEKLQQRLEEREKELDEMYRADGGSGKRSRVGENTIRKYIRGALDIDRTTFISFLLFFGSTSDIPPENMISEERLTGILLECGFEGLREDNAFDHFVTGFLMEDDPVDYLMQQVTEYALDEENFFLYHVYQASRSADRDMEELIGS